MFKILTPQIKDNTVTFTYETHGLRFLETHVFPFSLEFSRSTYALAIGVAISYYKLYLDEDIYIDWDISIQEKAFWQWIYNKGFSELIYDNKIPFDKRRPVTITCSSVSLKMTLENIPNYSDTAVLGIGGGKDSTLAKVLLDEAKVKSIGYSTEIKPSKIIERNALSLQIPLLSVERIIDPQLKTNISNTYNGHIPISLIYALTGVVIAEHEKIKYVVVANEASTEEENIIWDGINVNHQWSKTFEFEKQFYKHVITSINANIHYFSILRSLSSVKIMELFVTKCRAQFESFSSCNNNFKINKVNTGDWCGICPKCLGTYILMKAFLDEDDLKVIFKKNYLDDTANTTLFHSLLGLSEVKVFDCVATKDETCFCISKIIDKSKDALIVNLSDGERAFIKERANFGDTYILEKHEHNIPENIWKNIKI